MRAVVLDDAGRPRMRDVPEPDPPGELVRVLACGLCGSDVEKLTPEHAGAVLGHEVVAETDDGGRVCLVHYRPAAPVMRPGGFAERARAYAWVDAPDVDDPRATMVEPLACVLRGARKVPRGRAVIVGHGFIGRLFAAVLENRGDDVFAVDIDHARAGRSPDGPVDTAIVCARGGIDTAMHAVADAGTVVVFADAGTIPATPVYRRELTVVGSRSATPEAMEEAARLLPELALPDPVVLPLERFAEGLELYRAGRALKVVFVP